MGLPSIRISFLEAARTAYIRSERGVVGLILRESVIPDGNPFVITAAADIPSGLSEFNEKQIRKALIGYTTNTQKLIVYLIPVLGQTVYSYAEATVEEGDNPKTKGWYILVDGEYVAATDTTVDAEKTYYVRTESTDDTATIEQYEPALNYFVQKSVNYMAIPTVETEGLGTDIATWVKDLHTDPDENSPLCAVLPNVAAQSEFIINYTTPSVTDEDGAEFTAEQYCARIAGLLASTPLTRSSSYAELPELETCTFKTREELNRDIDAGQFVIFYDGEKCLTGRGMNSFTNVTDFKSKVYKKIRIVDIMCLIKADIARTARDRYIGKYANSYDNKMLLVGAINDYFNGLVSAGALMKDANICEIDIEANREYLKDKGVDVTDMTEDDIRKANTDDQVFLRANISILDAMEDISLKITI